MHDKDHAAKVLFGNSEAVANLVNEAFFQGDNFFLPEHFHPLPAEAFMLEAEHGKGARPAGIVADALWQYDTGSGSHDKLLIIMEFQSKVNYFMPGRLFVEAALNINAQRREIDMKREAEWGRRGYASSKEYLSRFRKGDRIVKPLAVVVYFGEGEWDGPLNLNDMACPLPPELAAFDYDMRVPVVDLDKIPIEKVLCFEQNLKLVLLYGKGRKDPELLMRILAGEPGFRRMPRVVAELIQALFHTKIEIPKEQEEIDMCLAEELMIKEGERKGREEGERKGREEGRKEGMQESAERYIQMCRNTNTSQTEMLSVLKSVFLLSAQQAAALLNKA